ncbi:MAG: ribonuclease Z [Lachnospiraceae bacterium]|nr:ribonuclease Z [Lachnospiraceae bacterium]MBR4608649.1 ribonuclease Z [Lachnospiraceae bacterium]
MLDVCLLGTGGMMPLPYRWLTSLMMKYNGKSILIDCGEGTQIAMREKGWSAKPIDVICFTHYHADHVSGLPGLLLSMGNSERTEPLLVIGPKGLQRVVNALRVIAPELPFEIQFHELGSEQEDIVFDGFTIRAFRVNHNVVCYGYSLKIPRAGKFDKDRALAQEIPLKLWSRLQKGEIIEQDGKTYTPDMVMGADRKGLKVTYSTDTRPTQSIEENAVGSDLLILEGMYGDEENFVKAKEHRHMMMQEAAKIAAKAQVPELWLTHYSPAMPKADIYLDELRKIFPNVITAKDGRSVELRFDDEEEKA